VVIPKVARLDSPSPKKRSDVGVAAMLGVGCMGMVLLMVRRPGKIPAPMPVAQSAAEPSVLAPAQLTAPMVLRLVRITPQTNDSRTLRFALTEGRRLSARPGQFMTFTFLFDGRKVNRSYSICSSPATAGYVEITPKRVPTGCASIFLNDRAAPGLTVEASGPYGRFCFDETKHRNIVLIAAGSGITPIMAMLRYIDDLCLGTPILLLYSVRTENDIIFENELMEMNVRMKNFQYQIICSQPTDGWAGPRGRMDRTFIAPIIGDIAHKDFFLCGPAAFMTVVHYILERLQVPADHIHQESFGPGPQAAAPTETGNAAPPVGTGTATTVEFTRSGKTCSIPPGKTLLEAAAENGVAIPSACRQGQCGTCQTRLLSGKVAMEAENGLSPEAKARGFVLTCVGRACGPVKLDA
jgi:ferredoxin-NADP reductase